jgi:hypothetical protein
MRVTVTPAHLALFLFFAWAASSLLWTVDLYGGLKAVWVLFLFVGLFCIGSTLTDLRSVYIGMAWGLSLSSIASIAQQFFGWEGVSQFSVPAGLFINPNFMAEAAALVLIGLIAERLWWHLPMVLPAVLLAGSRGALLALVIALALWTRSKAVVAITALAIVGAGVWAHHTGHRATSTQERLDIWADAASGMKLFGNGAGSFYVQYPAVAVRTDTYKSRPDHAHNDLVEAGFEYGLGACLLVLALGYGLVRGRVHSGRLVLVGAGVIALVSFPLHNPVTVFLVGLVAGRLAADGHRVWWPVAYGGMALRQRRAYRKLWRHPDRIGSVPAGALVAGGAGSCGHGGWRSAGDCDSSC